MPSSSLNLAIQEPGPQDAESLSLCICPHHVPQFFFRTAFLPNKIPPKVVRNASI